MATDVASLAIKIESLQVQQAEGRLKGLSSAGGGAERATSGLAGAFTKLIGPLTAAVSIMGTLNKLVSVQREFDVLNAGLITATGSAENAALAFEALEEFAAATPYGLQQAVDGFTKLVNLGLEPSERALMSYGNTAAAMGKDMMQMVEAVADASTFEFERLKEFGIKASQEGDKVKFTFRGTTTEVKKNAQEIEEYLLKLGEVEFAGAMENRAKTLDGAIAELGDTWDGLFRAINERGVGEAMEKAVRMAIGALEELTAMVESGQIEHWIASQMVQWAAWGEDISTTIDIVSTFLKDTFGEWEDEGKAVVDFLIAAFQYLPSNIRAVVQILVVEFAAGVDRMIARAEYWRDTVVAVFTSDTIQASMQRFQARMEGIQQARMDSIGAALKERDATIAASDEQVKAAAKARAEYDKAAEARKKAASEGDRLARFRVQPTGKPDAGGGGGGSKASKKASDAAAREIENARKQRERDYANLKESLLTEEEAIAASYEKRSALIAASTGAGSAERADMMARLDADHSEQLKKLADQKGQELETVRMSLRTEEETIAESYAKRLEIIRANTDAESALRGELEGRAAQERDKALADLERSRQSARDALYNGLLTEEEMLIQSYERKKEQILESEEVTELERQDLLRRLKKQFDDEQQQAEMARINSQLQQGEALFGGLAGLAKSYAGEQSGAYRALFAVSKAFSVAQAALSISTGIAKAQELGFPANLAEMARVAATGASIMSQINGSQFAGAYDKGGQIPAGKIGLVGEYGPELVRGPAAITGREATMRAFRQGDQGPSVPAAPPQVNIRQINTFDPGVMGNYLAGDEGEQLILNTISRNRTTIRNSIA